MNTSSQTPREQAPAPAVAVEVAQHAEDEPAEVLRESMARSHSPSDRIAWALDLQLLTHHGLVSTDADYPGWTPGGAA